MNARDAHAASLGVESRREGAQRVDAAADPVLRLEDHDLVTLPLQLEAGHESGQAGTDDDDASLLVRPALQPLGGYGQGLCGQRRTVLRPRLRRGVGQVLGQLLGRLGRAVGGHRSSHLGTSAAPGDSTSRAAQAMPPRRIALRASAYPR